MDHQAKIAVSVVKDPFQLPNRFEIGREHGSDIAMRYAKF